MYQVRVLEREDGRDGRGRGGDRRGRMGLPHEGARRKWARKGLAGCARAVPGGGGMDLHLDLDLDLDLDLGLR